MATGSWQLAPESVPLSERSEPWGESTRIDSSADIRRLRRIYPFRWCRSGEAAVVRGQEPEATDRVTPAVIGPPAGCSVAGLCDTFSLNVSSPSDS